MVRARRLREAFTVEGLRDRWHAAGVGARMLRDDVAQAQADKETELRERLGLPPHGGPPQLTAPAARGTHDRRDDSFREGTH
jgi:hypothetical protein